MSRYTVDDLTYPIATDTFYPLGRDIRSLKNWNLVFIRSIVFLLLHGHVYNMICTLERVTQNTSL